MTGGGGARSLEGLELGDIKPDNLDIFGGGGACISSTEIRIQTSVFAWNIQKRGRLHGLKANYFPNETCPFIFTFTVGRRGN